MKRRFVYISLIALILTLISGAFNSWAEEASPAASGSMSFLSRYMWRGYELSDDSIVVQPSMTLGYKGFAFNAWGNLDTSPPEGDAALNETDLTFSYDTSKGPFGLGAGFIYYGLDSTDDSQEFYLKASYATLLTPTVMIYKDTKSFPGYYINLGLSHSISLTDSIALSLSGAFGYYISKDDDVVEAGTDDKYNGVQDGLLSATLSIPVAKYLTLSPTVSYAFPLSNKAEDSLGLTSGEILGGVVLSFAF
jgi:hypothetical protein